MNSRIAVPVHMGRISPLFDVAGRFIIADISDGRVAETREIITASGTCAEAMEGTVDELRKYGVTVLICGAISRHCEERVRRAGMTLIPFLCGNTGEVMAAFARGEELHTRFRAPGQGRRRHNACCCPRRSTDTAGEENMRRLNPMKIAITATEDSLDAQLDERFGRAAGFIIYDVESGQYEYVENAQNRAAMEGAGIQASKKVIESGAGALITGNLGPKAYQVLSKAGIGLFYSAGGTVKESIQHYKDGTLARAEGASAEAHW